ncbi:unnamed protein product [Hymenolepis diminuta]|uniref:Armadillo repeat-containing protein n=1 Tax=Hymenolepis diminuta TaxID=6216 RepID=A0A0R3S9K2_HYMDI|nr:unnamed protein product [Hymenolepis diminuta]
MTIDIDSTLNSESIPNLPKGAGSFALPRTPPEHSAHFYLGSSSGDGTCDQLLTEFEINSKPDAFTPTHFSGAEENDDVSNEQYAPSKIDDEYIAHVIDILSCGSPDEISSAAAYLCHITFRNDKDVKKHALFVLRNLSHDPTPETQKRIDDASVISNLLVVLNEISNSEPLLSISTNDAIVESTAATLCNLALYQKFKDTISRNGVPCLIKTVIMPYCEIIKNQFSYNQSESPIENFRLQAFIYATGTIRNLLDEDAESRHRLRETPGFITALTYICAQCIEDYEFDSKALENCVCILRNLSFALQEIRDPAYLIRREAEYSKLTTTPMTEKKLEFHLPHIETKGRSRGLVMDMRRSSVTNIWMSGGPDYLERPPSNLESIQGSRLLWDRELVENYICILRHSSNCITLEAAAGAIQNLTACDWQPSVEVRSIDDGLVQTTATALRNVAEQEDLRNQIAFYAMRLLIARLPVLQAANAIDGEMVLPTQNLVSLPTASAILAALYVLIKGSTDRASLFLDCGGVQPCMAIAHTGLYLDSKDPVPSNRDKTVRFARLLLQTLWKQKELRERFQEAGWSSAHFCVCEPIIRPALKQCFLTNVQPTDTKQGATTETRYIGAPVPLGRVNEDGELIQDDEEDALPVRAGSNSPSSPNSDRTPKPRPRNSLKLAASAIDLSTSPMPNGVPYTLPNPKSTPLLQLPDSSPSAQGHVIRPASRLSLVPGTLRPQTPRAQSQGSITPARGGGYFSRLNVPEVIAQHPTPKREIQIERSVSPFLRPSPSNQDIRSLVPTTPSRNQNQLCVPGQEKIPSGLRTDVHRSVSDVLLEIPEETRSSARRSISHPNFITPSVTGKPKFDFPNKSGFI